MPSLRSGRRNVHRMRMTGRRKEIGFFLLSRTGLLSRESLCKLNFLTRARDKGRSLPQAPSPADAGCHPRHFDIDEGNLREHCWRRRLMRRVRARAPGGSRGPLYPRPPPVLTFPIPFPLSLSLSSSACCMMNCISTPYRPANDCPARLPRHSAYYCARETGASLLFRVIAIK